jgi:peptide deformylase
MILPIYIYGQPVLRKVAEDITPDYPDLKELIQNMYETLDNSNGVGLAAPQIGKAIRVVVIDLDVLKEDEFQCGWSQGIMTSDEMKSQVENLIENHDVIMIDVCG